VVSALLQASGPLGLDELAAECGLTRKSAAAALEQLLEEELVAEGRFLDDRPAPQYWWKARLQEERKRSLAELRREIEPVSVERYVDFVLRWQHVHPDTRLSGRNGLRKVLGQLELHDDLIRLWERDFLPARVADYDPSMLDELIRANEVTWGTFNFRFAQIVGGKPGSHGLQFCLAENRGCSLDVPWERPDELDGKWARECGSLRELLERRGPHRLPEIASALELGPEFAACLVWRLVSNGEVTGADLIPLRSCDFARPIEDCLGAAKEENWRNAVRRMKARGIHLDAGTWRLVHREPRRDGRAELDRITEERARLILARYGVISVSFTRLYRDALPRAQFRKALDELVLKGEAITGKFVEDVRGPQYALPEAAEELKRVRRPLANGPIVMLNRHDPANLFGSGIDSYDEDGDKVIFGRPGRWYLFIQGGRVIAVMYATDSGRDHFAIDYFRFTFQKYRNRTRNVLKTIAEHVRGRAPAAGYCEIRLFSRWSGQSPRGRALRKTFEVFGFEDKGTYMGLTLE